MSKQVKKEERIKYARNNKFDKYNTLQRDANPNKLTSITDGVVDTHFPCRDFHCTIDWYPRKFGIGELPECYSRCRKLLSAHGCGPDGMHPVVETITKYLKKNPNSIYITRGLTYWLWNNKIPLIFRPCWDNGFALHHLTGNPFEDDQTSIIKVDLHMKINGVIRKINSKIFSIQEFLQAESNNIEAKRQLDEQIKERKRISFVNTDPDVWRLIDKLYREASNIGVVHAVQNVQQLAV